MERGNANVSSSPNFEGLPGDGVDHSAFGLPAKLERLKVDAVDAVKLLGACVVVDALGDVLHAFFDCTPRHRLPAAETPLCAVAVVVTAERARARRLLNTFHVPQCWAGVDGVFWGRQGAGCT